MKATARSIAKITLKFFGLHAPLMAWIDARKVRNIRNKNTNSVLSWQKRFPYGIFIETGTHKGDMVDAVKRHFRKAYSIELGDELWRKARERFKDENHIEIVHGDSSEMLSRILAHIREPVIFWLDAHDSRGDTVRGKTITPIEEELEQIFNHPVKNHVILIDDARDFTGHGGYPSAARIQELARTHNYLFEMKKDNFRLYPKRA
ncbi:MAG: hypothetical protein HY007_02735 [Candidatus Sungbacteria bacterium]|nr:hypothetical protein [Candidatus Sungbacteria bacterium]